MKPPSKPFFVEVRRSRSVPTSTPAPQRPAPAWEETAEPAGTRSRAWQHAEQFFQPRTPDPVPEARAEAEQPIRILAPVPAEPAVEQKDEPAVPERSRSKAKDAADAKPGGKRGRKAVPVVEATEPPPVVERPPRRPRQARPDQPSEMKTAAPAREVLSPFLADEDEPKSDKRRSLSAQDARSAAKPGDRWTCRLRHVRRNLGSGRLGQPRS